MPAKSVEISEGFEPVAKAFARAPDVEVAGGWGAGNVTWKVGGKEWIVVPPGGPWVALAREALAFVRVEGAKARTGSPPAQQR
jgi:hypothetical protein